MPAGRRDAASRPHPQDTVAEAGQLRPIGLGDLDAVLHIEAQSYAFPWTRGNFIDSLAAGYWAQALFRRDDDANVVRPGMVAYAWAMPGVDEVHLLNLTVAPWARGRGHARSLLDHLVAWSLAREARQLWLEVRPSNARAIALYERYGFRTVGRRPGYYPAPHGRREDATVMGLALAPAAPRPSNPAEDGSPP